MFTSVNGDERKRKKNKNITLISSFKWVIKNYTLETAVTVSKPIKLYKASAVCDEQQYFTAAAVDYLHY